MSSSRCEEFRWMIWTQPISRVLFGASGHIRQEIALGAVGVLGVSPGIRQVLSHALAFGNVANVALNHAPSAFRVNVADEFHGNMPAVAVLQRMIFIPDVAGFLQLRHGGLRAFGILEDAYLPQFLRQEVFPRIAKQLIHEGVDV
jgi:hypothetical protein